MKKPYVLQEFSFYDYSDVFIEFVVRTDEYRDEELSKMLNLEPDRAWNKGDKYSGKQKNTKTNAIETVEQARGFGLWAFSTRKFVEGNRFEEHAEFLLEKLDHSKETIQKLLGNEDAIKVYLFVYLKIDRDQDYFGIGANTDILLRLLKYAHYFEWRKDLDDNFD